MLEQLVQKYVTLRNRKAELKAKFDADTADINQTLDRCEQYFLKTMNAQGLDALPTEFGVPYKQRRTSATVGDWDATLGFIREQEAWHMLEKRVAKNAVEEYRTEHDDLPPGINWREEIVVNVRAR